MSTYKDVLKKELESIEKISNAIGRGEEEELYFLVRRAPKISAQEWEDICCANGLQGWERIELSKECSIKDVQQACIRLEEKAQTALIAIQEVQTILNNINMEIQRVERGSGEFSVLMIQAVASEECVSKAQIYEYTQELLQRFVRAYDTIALIDNHYFIVILPGASASNARLFAKRFQTIAVEKMQERMSSVVPVELYIGISTYRAGMPVPPKTILDNASEALKEAIEKKYSVHQISSHLLGDTDRASMVHVAEKRLLFSKKDEE